MRVISKILGLQRNIKILIGWFLLLLSCEQTQIIEHDYIHQVFDKCHSIGWKSHSEYWEMHYQLLRVNQTNDLLKES